MITNLFSVFDPATGNFSLNWIRIISIIFLPIPYWNLHRKTIRIVFLILKKIIIETIIHLKKHEPSILIVRIFILILTNNIIGIIPYVFTATSHLSFSLPLALTIWLSIILYGWINKTNRILVHLVPMGTPVPLIPFIVLIESIRNLIRPISLAVRLAANIIAGHLLISLLGNNLLRNRIIMIIIIWLFITLIIFETAVALIQSYVFITLSTLYSREV